MLIQFSVENFLSFKTSATLSMVAGKIKSKDSSLDNDATFKSIKDLTLLKCAAIYGANASGKSNLLSALGFLRGYVINSSKESQVDESIPIQPFRLASGFSEKPSRFEISILVNDLIYQYEFSADKDRIHKEKLIVYKGSREIKLFDRKMDQITVYKPFSEGLKLEDKTRSNALFISVCANFDGTISKSIVRWFRNLNVISGMSDDGLINFTRDVLGDERKHQAAALLKNFDLGIDRLELGESIDPNSIPDGVPDDIKKVLGKLVKISNKNGAKAIRRINSVHKFFDSGGKNIGEVLFDLDRDESEGTKKLVAMSGPLLDTLKNSKVLVIDEFDARLHPIISKTIIKIFNSMSTNINNAQLIVATHDTNLLDRDLLRRDQIWFSEKDKCGSSYLTSLVEYKVRNDASFEKDYIMGKYGAIPIPGYLGNIFESPDVTQIENMTSNAS
ncbi:AAA15 family ATPase/GTPase [Oxalobacteraceae bacterium GrIS 1.18]